MKLDIAAAARSSRGAQFARREDVSIAEAQSDHQVLLSRGGLLASGVLVLHGLDRHGSQHQAKVALVNRVLAGVHPVGLRGGAVPAGKYYLVCLVPGHIQSGMWDYFTISTTAKKPSIQVTK